MKKEPDFRIFYSLEVINSHRESAANSIHWGEFISLEHSIHDAPSPYHIHPCVNTVDFTPYRRRNVLFDVILDQINTAPTPENYYRCSAKYYAECFDVLMQQTGTINRIVEVSPHLGDLSCVFAGALEKMDATLDLVDTNPMHLLQTYERIKAIFPEAAAKVRLFFGDLPLYVKKVALRSPYIHLIHYKGSCNFNDVVRDVGSTFYARNKIVGTMIHNTHLRTTDMNSYAFTDVAIYSLFGLNVKFVKLGEESSVETTVNGSQEPPVYFASARVDGMYIPYQQNNFRYPHHSTTLDNFFEKNEVI